MLAIILAGLAFLVSGATFVLVLVLLGRKDFAYATRRDVDGLADRVAVVERGQRQLYRYTEAIDEHTGANGHRVLSSIVPGFDSVQGV